MAARVLRVLCESSVACEAFRLAMMLWLVDWEFYVRKGINCLDLPIGCVWNFWKEKEREQKVELRIESRENYSGYLF